MKKLLLATLLLIFSCDEVLDTLGTDDIDLDVTSPIVVITFPSAEVPLTAPTTVKAQVTDNGDIVTSTGAISYVKFLIDGTEVLTDTIPPYEYEWDVCVQATGTHTITVIAEDISSNIGLSEVLSFTINASYDCAGVCGGDKLLDNCEVCDADTTNDCVQDSAGNWGGTAVLSGCDNVCNSTAVVDAINICGGSCLADANADGICDNLQGTVSDVDGNTYKTIKIGEQWWMTENLNTSKYRDETSIPEEQDGDIDGVDAGSDYWTGLITGAWSYYNNDSANGEVYGKIYNWYAVNGDINGDGTKDKELCPQGWHVPSSSEFTTLIDYLGGSHSAYTSLKDGGNSGFNAISVPFRFGCGGSSCNNGGFGINSNYDRSFWAATSVDELSGYYLRIDTSDTPPTSVVWSNNKHGGKSVRCIKD